MEDKTLEILMSMQKNMDTIMNTVTDMQKDMKDMKQDMKDMQEDMKDMQEDIKDMQEDMKDMQEDMRDMKEDMKDMKQDIQGLKEGQERIETKLESTHNQTVNLTEFRTEVNAKLDSIIKEVVEVEEVTKVNCYDIAKLKACR